jgi:hypothetical protein
MGHSVVKNFELSYNQIDTDTMVPDFDLTIEDPMHQVPNAKFTIDSVRH